MTAREWIDRFVEVLGTEAPDESTTEVLLELAGEAAHGSERIAAPIACFLAGRVGIDPAAALELARELNR